MGAGFLLSVAAILCSIALGSSKVWEIPISDSLQNCYNRANNIDVDNYVGSVFSWLCEHTLNMNSTYPTEPIPKETITYINQLFDIEIKATNGSTQSRPRRQASPRCVRKEYRVLTREERRRYHAAINALKRDKTTRPNKYDAIANIHTLPVKQIAHGGPGFLGWHRMYLLMYENALRSFDPSVCLPYWDSTLDSKLQDPFMSSMWTPEFMGNPRGNVNSGPFANWVLPNGGQLIRNVGIDGGVLTTNIVNNILSRNSYNDIVTSDTVDPLYQLEYHHGLIHDFVGGTMNSLITASFEPVFYMHHAFIDYIWERFRSNLRSNNVNPEIYPSTRDPLHQGTALMGFAKYTQADGYREIIANRVTYQPVPTCNSTSPSCGAGSSLVCRTSDWLCIPTTRTAPGSRTKRQATTQDTCDKPPSTYALPNQNDYCVGPSCDTDKWVMIPVKIISVRPPKFKKYDSYPVKKGRIDDKCDIYASKENEVINKFIFKRQGKLKTFERCQEDSAVGQIFLYSHGINYPGYYKESTIVDQKLTVSVSLGFIGVKKPSEVEGGVSKALLRAHDSCGRVCQVSCKDEYSKRYKVCSGAVAVNDKTPLMYGQNLDEAVLSVIDYSMNEDAPEFKEDTILITFYCDYSRDFPFAVQNNQTAG